MDDIIGTGAFGKVYKYKDKNTGIQYAMKNHSYSSNKYDSSSLKEIDIMRKFNSPFIIKLVKFIFDGNGKIDIIMPLMTGSLHDYLNVFIESGIWIHLNTTRDIFSQLAHGLEFLHDNGVWHNDIKFANVLYINENGALKFCWSDFGSSLYNSRGESHRISQVLGTPEFRAPEFNGNDEGDFIIYPTSDIWNFGMMLFYMISDQWRNGDVFGINTIMYTESSDKNNLLNRYIQYGGNPILIEMLNPDPLSRTKIQDIMKDPYIINYKVKQIIEIIPEIKYILNAKQIIMMKQYIENKYISNIPNIDYFRYYLFADICHRCPSSFDNQDFLNKINIIVWSLDNSFIYGIIKDIDSYKSIIDELDGYIYRSYIYDRIKSYQDKLIKYLNSIYDPNYLNFDISKL